MISPRELVSHAARTWPAGLAVVDDWGTLTHRELGARVARLRQRLAQQGVGPGVQVGIQLSNSLAFVAWTFAALEVGAVLVPLARAAPGDELLDMVVRGGVGWLATEASPPAGFEVACPPDDDGVTLWRRPELPDALEVEPGRPESWVLRQSSSGSTGRPKHMLRSEANLAEDYGHFCRTLGLEGPEVFLVACPLSHAYGALGMLAALHLGGTLMTLPRFLPTPALELARRFRPTVFLATPPMLEILSLAALDPGLEGALASLRYCISSAGPLSARVHEAFLQRFGVPVHVQYGSTETLSASVDLGTGPFVEGRVGRPYQGVEVSIRDPAGVPLAAGGVGEVAIRSRAACREYQGDPEATRRTFRDGWVYPGDRGSLDPEGVLHLAGRADVINIGGDKVDPLEVAGVLREALPVGEVLVLGGERAGVPVVRVVLEADPAVVTPARVQEVCRRRLSPHKVPSLIEIFPRLPRDDAGKLRRDRLPEPGPSGTEEP